MDTLVFQSYRRTDVPAWIARCLASVSAWSAAHGYQYRFLGDELFDCVPNQLRERVRGDLVPMSDFARLDHAREFLAEGFGRVIWVDADVAVFDADRLTIAADMPFGFCREVWIDRDPRGSLYAHERINNAICTFSRGNCFLDFYRHACLMLAQNFDIRLNKLSFGTGFLSRYRDVFGTALIENVGMISPLMVDALSRRSGDGLWRLYRKHAQVPMAAGNFCASFRHAIYHGARMDDGKYETALNVLMAAKGGLPMPVAPAHEAVQ